MKTKLDQAIELAEEQVKQCLLDGNYKVKSINDHTAKVKLEGNHDLTIWLGNGPQLVHVCEGINPVFTKEEKNQIYSDLDKHRNKPDELKERLAMLEEEAEKIKLKLSKGVAQ